MSLAYPFRCIVCMLFYKDRVVTADRGQACSHIYYDHDYTEKLRAGRMTCIVKEDERRGARWLANHLAELSFLQE